MPDAPSSVLLAFPAVPERLENLEEALTALDGDETMARVAALLTLVAVLPLQEAGRQATLAAEAYTLAGRLGDAAGQARAAGLRGRALFLISENEAALPMLVEAIARFEALGMAEELLAARGALASAHASLGHYEDALRGAFRNLADVRASGDRLSEGWVLNGLSTAYADLGDTDNALAAARQARGVFEEIGYPLGLARAETSQGAALLLLGEPDAAEAHLHTALAGFHDLDDPIGASRALDDLGTAARLRGDVEAGLALHREALARRRPLANRHALSTSLLHIGEALVALGRPAEALPPLDEALDLACSIGARPREAQVHAALVEAHGALGEPAQALVHARAHMAVREAILDAETRSRLQTMQVRFETDRLREARDAEAVRSTELLEANRRLSETLEELQAAQRQLVQAEKLSSLGRVTAGIAHEIKNPLNFVVGFADLAADLTAELAGLVAAHPLPGAAGLEATEALGMLASNVARIAEHGRRADGIVASMLEHVRTVGGPRGLVAVSDLVEAALAEARASLGASALPALRVGWENEAAGVEIEAVGGSLRRVFANLFANAFAALADRDAQAPTGWTPTLTVRIRVTETGGARAAEVAVSDNGPGVPARIAERVFEPFVTTRPAGQGTGLGLSLAYDIVTEGHGGRLEYAEAPGGGATFTVTLPAAEGHGG